MCEARRRENWDHTSWLLCMSYNANRGKGQKAKDPEDFHPLRKKTKSTGGIPLTAANIHMLRVFVDGSKRDKSR